MLPGDRPLNQEICLRTKTLHQDHYLLTLHKENYSQSLYPSLIKLLETDSMRARHPLSEVATAEDANTCHSSVRLSGSLLNPEETAGTA